MSAMLLTGALFAANETNKDNKGPAPRDGKNFEPAGQKDQDGFGHPGMGCPMGNYKLGYAITNKLESMSGTIEDVQDFGMVQELKLNTKSGVKYVAFGPKFYTDTLDIKPVKGESIEVEGYISKYRDTDSVIIKNLTYKGKKIAFLDDNGRPVFGGDKGPRHMKGNKGFKGHKGQKGSMGPGMGDPQNCPGNQDGPAPDTKDQKYSKK